MAIYGVGLDLVQVERLQRILDRWGDRFEKRVFTAEERAMCGQRRNRAACLALRFAAKEAFVKALGTGIRGAMGWLDIEVRRAVSGQPGIVLSPSAAAFCRELRIHSWHLSLTDDGAYGAAVVILECQEDHLPCSS
ncbi:MAG TPA: holo-[acyl-carrier-protein] synthase [Syntrophobacteraceae bacterium]|nr:holo-[acyl-carrier-protein] synthase [Syntrophobacteraceae bacterium]